MDERSVSIGGQFGSEQTKVLQLVFYPARIILITGESSWKELDNSEFAIRKRREQKPYQFLRARKDVDF
jgi:hypothetical protein